MLLSATSIQLLPPFSLGLALGLLAAVAVGALVLRWLLGSANPVARRGVLWGLRGAALALIGLILVNPVRMSELSGPVQRPEIFYLLDTSASAWRRSIRRRKSASHPPPRRPR